jgi:hypothetical protein
MAALTILIGLSATLQASDGRAASLSLSKAEVACRDVPEAERDASLLTNPATIRSVAGRNDGSFTTQSHSRRAGARLVLSASPGLTAEGLQHIADCHIARVAALGAPTRPTHSPLDVKGASVVVRPKGNAFVVDITSTDQRAARTILSRARALLPGHSQKY